MDNAQQFELFQNLEKPESSKGLKPKGHSVIDFWRFKRAIFLVLYSIVVLIIGFVSGVEHAKNKSAISFKNLEQAKTSLIDTKTKDSKSDDKLIAKQPQVRAVSSNNLSADIEKKGKISIQLASFKNTDIAKKELQVLKNKGYPAYLVSFKGFFKLYAGPFKTKDEAGKRLKDLKARYPDCFIARNE